MPLCHSIGVFPLSLFVAAVIVIIINHIREGLVVLWLPTWSRMVQVPPVSGHFSLPLFNVNAHQMWRCFTASFRGDGKAIGPGGPGLISLRLFQVLVSLVNQKG